MVILTFSIDAENVLIASMIVTFLIIIYIYYIKAYHVIRSDLDNKEYSVLSLDDSKHAANMLAKINLNITQLAEHLEKKYGTSNDLVNNVLLRYNPDVIYESVPTWFNDGVAYTSGKGKSIYICLRDTHNNNVLHDINTIMFVALHELSHIATNAVQHPKEFWQTFKFILIEAAEVGIYTPIDYSVTPTNYCNEMKITYNPMFDPTV